MKKKAIYLSLLFICIGCASLFVPAKQNLESSFLCVSVKILQEGICKNETKYPKYIYFLKLDDNKEMLEQTNIIISNFAFDEYHYLFNAKPGLYAIVGAYYEKNAPNEEPMGTVYQIKYFFSSEVIKKSVINLRTNEKVFLGEYTFRNSYEKILSDHYDKTRLHFTSAISPEIFKTSSPLYLNLGGPMIIKHTYPVNLISVINDEGTQEKFRSVSKKLLRKTSWN